MADRSRVAKLEHNNRKKKGGGGGSGCGPTTGDPSVVCCSSSAFFSFRLLLLFRVENARQQLPQKEKKKTVNVTDGVCPAFDFFLRNLFFFAIRFVQQRNALNGHIIHWTIARAQKNAEEKENGRFDYI